ncbi:MAG: response regulator transcription factor [Chitinophagaceae bacterium]
MKKVRLIILESHHLMREAWMYALKNDERVEVAGGCTTHDEALFLCDTERPDVLLFSIGMNLQNDFATIYQILRDFPGIKVIGMSINSRPMLAQKVMETGVHGFVTKSSSMEEMVKAILEVSEGNLYVCHEVRELTA